MNGHKTQCVAGKETVLVYTAGGRVRGRGGVQSTWISKVNGRGEVGKNSKGTRYILKEPEKPAAINSRNQQQSPVRASNVRGASVK